MTTAVDAPAPDAPPKAIPRRRKWLRRAFRVAGALGCLILLIRLTMPVLLPVVIGRTARALGVTCTYDRIKLSLLGTNATLWDLTIRSKDGNAELLRAGYANANLSTLQLFRLRLFVWRLEADDVTLDVVRRQDGSIPLLTHLAALSSGKAQKPAPNKPRSADFDAPLEVKALRLHTVTVRLKDESVTPPFEDTVRLDVRVSNIGRAGSAVDLALDVGSDGLFSAGRFEGQATAAGSSLDADFRFSLRGLHADRVGGYLSAVGLTADDRNIDMSGRGSFAVRASKSSSGVLEGSASLADITLRAASQPVAALSKADLAIAALSPSEVHVSDLRITDGSLRAERTEDGRFRFAAFSPGPARARTPRPAQPPPLATPAPARSPLRWRVDRVVATSLAASIQDRAVFPASTLSVQLVELNAAGLSSEGAPDSTATFGAKLTAPGLVGEIRVDGRATPFDQHPGAAAAIEFAQIRPDALLPYLRALGIESTLEAASVRLALAATLDPAPGATRAGLVLDRVVLLDRGEPLAEVGPLTLKGLAMGPSGALEIDSLEGSGPVLSIRRLADGRIEIPGLRLGNPRPAPTVPPAHVSAPAAPPGSTSRPSIPSVRIGKLAWGAVKVRFEDLTLPEQAPFDLADAMVDIDNLVLGRDASGPATLRISARAPGLLDQVDIAGTLTPGADSLALDASVQGNGAALTRLTPYLERLSIKSSLEGAAFTAHVTGDLARTEHGIRASFTATDAALRQGDTTLAGVAHAGVDRIDIEPGRVAVGRVDVRAGELIASRDASGAFSAAGITLLPSKAPADPEGAPVDPLALLAALGNKSLQELSIDGLKLQWSDSRLRRPVSMTATVNASLGQLTLNKPDAPPTPLDLRLAATGTAKEIHVSGTLRAGGDGIAVEARVTGDGLSADAIAPYLPTGIESSLRNGRLELSAALALRHAQEGGFGATVSVRDFDYREGGAPSPLAHAGSFSLEIDRLDPAAGDVVIRRIAAEGIAADARRRPDGALDLLGLALAPAPEPPGAPAPPPPPGNEVDLARIVQGSRLSPPLFAIDTLDLGIDRVTFTDAARGGAAPVSITATRVRSASPIRLFGPRPEENPPARLEVRGTVDPLIREFAVAAEAAPFAEQPIFNVSITAAGIDGASLTKVAPELAPLIDGSPLADGRFKTTISGDAKVHRRGQGRIDFSRGVELNLTAEDTEFKSGESGPVLIGVGKVRAEQVKVDPPTGNVIARNLELEQVSGNAWRDEAGVHVLGMIIKPLSKPAEPATPSAEPGKTGSAARPPDAAQLPGVIPAPLPEPPPAPEIRIERLSASGLDFRFEDRALTPPVVLPIDALDAEIRGLSSQVLTRDRPVRFNLSIGAGTVSLPKRVQGGALTGAISDMLGGLGGRQLDTAPEMEDRQLFSQLIASGTMSLYPTRRGRAIVSINGLELAAVRGLAQAAGASVGGGVFDGRVDLQARDDGAVSARTRLVLTDLRYTEPPSGPVERYMSLPVPVDAAITVVQDTDGSITLPVDVTLDERGLTTGKLLGAIAGAAGQVVATAIASAPIKIVGGFAGLFVDTKHEATWVEEDPIMLGYPEGVSALPPEQADLLVKAIARARNAKRIQMSIEHRLGAVDTALTARRANPAAADAVALAADLRRRRADLIARRDELLSPASAATIGLPGDPDAPDRLRRLHEELADVEDSMDRLFDLQRPSADTLADRRSRAAAIELIDARMGAVRQAVHRLAGPATARIAVGGSKIEPSGAEESRLIIRVRRRK